MFDIDYIVVPTSNSDYQEWQCRFLNWSRKKVNQTGKLIFLMSEDTPDREFPEFDDAEVVRLPNWAAEWESKHNDWWGGVPNKYNSIKWLLENTNLSGSILFLDPDMIFLEPVQSHRDLEKPFLEGQTWFGYSPDHLNGIFSQFNRAVDPFMCPYITNTITLEKIINSYSTYSELIRKASKEWISEMYGLYYSAVTHNIPIELREDLGHCTAWWSNNSVDGTKLPSIIHYPNDILGKNGESVWFKQNYTTEQDSNLTIDYSNVSTLIETRLLENLEQFREESQDKVKSIEKLGIKRNTTVNMNACSYKLTPTLDIYKHYDGSDGFISYDKWPGGFNNIRMSFELAVCIAYLTNRTLVLPPNSDYYLLEGSYSLSDFFDLSKLQIKYISHDQSIPLKKFFLREKNDQHHTFTYPTADAVYNFTYVNVPADILKGRMQIYLNTFKDKSWWYFDSNLLGSFDNVIFSDKRNELKELVRTNIVYREDLFNISKKFINSIDGEYNAIHIRRNDFQYKDTFIEPDRIIGNIKNVIPSGSKLYIATDHKEFEYFNKFKEHYEVIFYQDLLTLVDIDVPFHVIPIIEQLICTEANVFVGAEYSTLSSYVYRLRHYLSDSRDLDTNYYVNTSFIESKTVKDITLKEDSQFKANWYREYKDVATLENETIFVSIASYCDTDLINTIKNLLSKAANSERVVVGVHIQDTLENYHQFLEEIRGYDNVKVMFTEKSSSQGVVWARNRIKYEIVEAEDYYLQIDAHTRFKQSWDNILITQYKVIDDVKVILTTYPNEFLMEETNEEYFRNPNNTALQIDRLLDTVRAKAKNTPPLDDYEIKETRWAAAGFLFTKRQWIDEIKLPSEIKYSGEEDLQTYMSYLQGWNLYVTSQAVVWHNYGDKSNGTVRENNPTLGVNDSGESIVQDYLFESVQRERTLNQLENYLGIDFRHKKLNKVEEQLYVFVWCIGDDFNSIKYQKLRITAKLHGINLYPLGQESPYSGNTKQRFTILSNTLKELPPTRTVMVIDGHDTLINGTAEEILQKYNEYSTELLVSAEKLWTWQWPEYKDRFDYINTPYRYVNAGTYMGPANVLLEMCDEISKDSLFSTTNKDQGLLGKWVYDHFYEKEKVELDKYNKVFWVTSGDWEYINDQLERGNDIYCKDTNTRPLVIHNTGNRDYSKTYELLFSRIVEDSIV